MNTRYRKILLVLLLGAWLSISAFATQKYGKVTGGYVNLRAEPSTSANIVGGVAKGDVVEVLNDLGNGWLSVSINGLHAYISASYVEILPEGAVKQNPKGVVNTNNVNVRAGPSTSDARLTIVSKNTEVEILAEENGWYKVQFGFQIGYIRADLINITSAPSTPSTPEPPSPPETEIPGVVTGTVVNVRSGAGTSYSVIGSVIKGDSVVVLETLNGWYKIRFGSETGYISSNYVSIEPTEPEPEEPEEPEQPEPETPEPEQPEPETLAVVTGSVVNVRSGAGTSYSVIGSVRKGESVVVLETLSGWYKIRLKSGQTGYISSNYVSIEPTEPEPEEPEEPKPEMLAVVTGSVVNVRSGAGTSFSVIGSVRKGESVVVLETVSGWFKIRLKSGQTGYISAEYATIQPATPDPETKTGLVTGSYVNIRIGPSTSTQSLGTVPRGSQVEILGKENGWYLVRLSDLTGYISENYIAAGAAAYKPPAYIIKAPSTNTVGRISDLSKTHNVSASGAVVNFAKTMIGIPYVYGGASPETGFDCSGLTQYVYNALGYELPRISQYNAGRAVAKNELLPGDLVFFGPNGTINHVGIYIGNNQFIHAPNSGRPVSIDSLNSVYYLTNYVRATRILS